MKVIPGAPASHAARSGASANARGVRQGRNDGPCPDRQQYVVLIPIKPPAIGKSRLTGISSARRRALAEAFALDTVMACAGATSVAQVLAITTDDSFADRLTMLGATTVPDGVPGDLNGTLRQAAVTAQRHWPQLRPAVVVADMPALSSADLDDVLSRVDRPEAFVQDAAGSGTTLYVGTYDNFVPRFGLGSRDAHLSAGAQHLRHAPLSVRRDVDDIGDLCSALSVGVGAHTAALVSLDLPRQFALR